MIDKVEFPNGKYGVIYADPPWSYKNYSVKGIGKGAAGQYHCMPLDKIKALGEQISHSADKDCALFMWATFPLLPEAIQVMASWGFQYKSGAAWHKKTKNGKTAFGTGYIFRSAAELLLVGTRGKPKVKNRSTRNLIEAETREHSRKPDETAIMIENLYAGPYLELFARTTRNGWSNWGNETDKFTDITK